MGVEERAPGVPGIREPDPGALPVATFTERDYEKPQELPSARWRRRAKRTLGTAIAAAIGGFAGLGLLSLSPHYEGVGVMAVLCAPIIIGTLVSLFPVDDGKGEVRGSMKSGLIAATLVMLFAGAFLREGIICILMASPILLSLAAASSAIANNVVARRFQKLDDKARATAAALVILLVPLVSSAIDQLFFFDKNARTTVTSSVTVPFSREDVWRSLEHLEVRFAEPSPFSVEALLPVPVAITGDGAARGAVRRVEFHNGVVVGTVTDLVPFVTYEIDLRLEDAGREFFDHWIDLRSSRFDLVDAGSPGAPATTLVHATTYRPLLFPRVVFEPIELSLGGLLQTRLLDIYTRQVLDVGQARIARAP